MKKYILIILLALLPLTSLAQNTPLAGEQGLLSGLNCLEDDLSTKDINEAGNCEICDIMIVANNIIKVILGLSGSIALLICIISGGYLLVSQGGKYKEKAFDTAKTAIIGLIIIFFAYPLVNLGLNLILGQEISGTAKLFTNQPWTEFCK